MPPRIPDIVKVRQLIPPLSKSMHKGQAGRVGVVGGSEDYTGAPYFSAIASMKVGVDLCHVFCEPGAGTVIKSYSPDLIVHPYMRTKEKVDSKDASLKDIVDRVSSVFSRLHVLVVGPGLSRDELMLDSAKELIYKAREKDMAIVIDADGLYLVQQHPETVKDYKKAVLTPNVVEFQRLCEKMNINAKAHPKDEVAQQLSKAFGGVTIVQKGSEDYIANADQVLKCDAEGGLKRMGGQGDILTGIIAAFLAWGKGYEDEVWEHPHEVDGKDIAMYASWAACTISRTSSRLAFQKHGRAVLTSHMLEEIGQSYDLFVNDKL
ncbi:carbohydrate kinase [Rhizopus microsporus ATCC 52813]|uniref:ATP-dependent (S)-NAD(P)H-hydrate dehydratase n=1 Tax=Rhizopus microsporus ATCC 52813 TaxID=1340429 RepID=A0A2G4SQE5_RHIZD|nr:carbohydrate kinase [Rhizopus microsporus ATCC 52813]PHZ10994.1 carbohydrate kinase [Rhizopus microsporus ATCC 52813]